jgi:DNA repair exonuclease SbcCD ATPase subunit
MTNFIQQFNILKSTFDQKQGMLQAFRSRLETCNNQISELDRKEDLSTKTSLFLQSLSDQTRINVLEKISGIVTEALQTIKDQNLEFRMLLSTERNAADLKMVVYDKQTQTEYDVLESMGGGIVDLVSISLRLALLCKWQPAISRILILDEAGKHISIKDQEQLADFISKLSKLLNCQFVWITHSEVLSRSADRVFEVTKQNGVSKVEEKNGRP